MQARRDHEAHRVGPLMPWMPGHSLQRLEGDLHDLRERVLALTREVGEARAETERWRGQAEAQAAQVARMETELERARAAVQDVQRKGAEEDPWGYDEKEYQRIVQDLEVDPLATMVREGGRTKMSG